MRKGFLFNFVCFAMILLFACGDKKPQEKKVIEIPEYTETLPYDVMCRTVVVQPFGEFPQYLYESLYEQIKEINPDAILRDPVPLPRTAYDERYDCYRADLLLESLKKGYDGKDYIVLGVTDKDLIRLNEEKLEVPTMGLASIFGYTSVVSTYQLSKNIVDDQLYRLAMHEIGHNEGLQHCKRYRNCIMYGKLRRNNYWHRLDFCPSCKMYMVLKGWEM
jgi:archaemetzincin